MTEPTMFPTTLHELSGALRALTVLRPVLRKKPLRQLLQLLDLPSSGSDSNRIIDQCAAYAASLLPYHSSLETYLHHCLAHTRTICVRDALLGNVPDPQVTQMLRDECGTLSAACGLSPDAVCAHLSYAESTGLRHVPLWSTSHPDLFRWYSELLRSVPQDGFGVFRGTPMLFVDRGRIVAVQDPDPVSLNELVGYEWQRKLIMDNVHALLHGKPASDMLLYGDSGTGKSSTIKAAANALWQEGLRLVEVRPAQLHEIPRLVRRLVRLPLKFILFIDDLSFASEDDDFRALKGTLEGTVQCRPRNVIVCATSNRRRLIRETFAERAGDDVHVNETIQQQTALSDRFGLTISFMDPNRDTYLQIVLDAAHSAGLNLTDAELTRGAEKFALEKGGRSGRAARQYVDLLKCGVIAP